MIICNQCGNSIADNLRFCTDCGAESPMFAAPVVRDPAPPMTIPYARAPQTTNYQPQPRQPAPPPYVPSTPPHVPAKSSSNAIVWVFLSFGVVVLVVIAVVGIKLSLSHSNDANNNTNRDANLSRTLSSTPSPNGRVVICKYNGVNVRDAPNNQTAGKVAVINIGQEVRIITESPNRDSVFIPSRKETVEDNWSEVQFEMLGTSYHGWIFSGFLR